MYRVHSAINPHLIYCTDGEFHTAVMVGPGGYRPRNYKRYRNAMKVRNGFETIIRCVTCDGDGKLMAATGDVQHPLRAIQCPDCAELYGRP